MWKGNHKDVFLSLSFDISLTGRRQIFGIRDERTDNSAYIGMDSPVVIIWQWLCTQSIALYEHYPPPVVHPTLFLLQILWTSRMFP